MQGADNSFLYSIANSVKPLTVLKGCYVFHKDDEGIEMYFIRSGAIAIMNDAGKILVTLKGGSYFGEIAIIEGCKRTATARAVEDSELCILTKSEFDSMLDEESHVRLMEAVAQIREKEKPKDGKTGEPVAIVPVVTLNLARRPTKENRRKSGLQARKRKARISTGMRGLSLAETTGSMALLGSRMSIGGSMLSVAGDADGSMMSLAAGDDLGVRQPMIYDGSISSMASAAYNAGKNSGDLMPPIKPVLGSDSINGSKSSEFADNASTNSQEETTPVTGNNEVNAKQRLLKPKKPKSNGSGSSDIFKKDKDLFGSASSDSEDDFEQLKEALMNGPPLNLTLTRDKKPIKDAWDESENNFNKQKVPSRHQSVRTGSRTARLLETKADEEQESSVPQQEQRSDPPSPMAEPGAGFEPLRSSLPMKKSIVPSRIFDSEVSMDKLSSKAANSVNFGSTSSNAINEKKVSSRSEDSLENDKITPKTRVAILRKELEILDERYRALVTQREELLHELEEGSQRNLLKSKTPIESFDDVQVSDAMLDREKVVRVDGQYIAEVSSEGYHAQNVDQSKSSLFHKVSKHLQSLKSNTDVGGIGQRIGSRMVLGSSAALYGRNKAAAKSGDSSEKTSEPSLGRGQKKNSQSPLSSLERRKGPKSKAESPNTGSPVQQRRKSNARANRPMSLEVDPAKYDQFLKNNTEQGQNGGNLTAGRRASRRPSIQLEDTASNGASIADDPPGSPLGQNMAAGRRASPKPDQQITSSNQFSIGRRSSAKPDNQDATIQQMNGRRSSLKDQIGSIQQVSGRRSSVKPDEHSLPGAVNQRRPSVKADEEKIAKRRSIVGFISE